MEFLGENMQNTLKINDYRKALSFCKYLHNESWDLYEILNLSSYDKNELPKEFSWRFVHAHIYTHDGQQSFIKNVVVVHYYHKTLSLNTN